MDHDATIGLATKGRPLLERDDPRSDGGDINDKTGAFRGQGPPTIHAHYPRPLPTPSAAIGTDRCGWRESLDLIHVPLRQNSKLLRSMPCTPFSPFTVCVTWKSTPREQN